MERHRGARQSDPIRRRSREAGIEPSARPADDLSGPSRLGSCVEAPMIGPMKPRRIAGNTTTSLLLLLVALLGVGAWNYYRNYQLERANEHGRPYSGYSTHEVELLRDAVAGELDATRARFERA